MGFSEYMTQENAPQFSQREKKKRSHLLRMEETAIRVSIDREKGAYPHEVYMYKK